MSTAHSRRIEHRAKVRKAAAGELNEADTKAVQSAENARKAAIKPKAVLNRRQRKNAKAARRAAR